MGTKGNCVGYLDGLRAEKEIEMSYLDSDGEKVGLKISKGVGVNLLGRKEKMVAVGVPYRCHRCELAKRKKTTM